MNSTRRGTQFIIAVTALLALGACGKSEPPAASAPPPPPAAPAPAPPPVAAAPVAAGTTFESLVFTNAVGADGKPSNAPTVVFTPKDTIYAVVTTNNSGTSPATIAAHWEFQGGVAVDDSSQSVSASGPSVTTFHIEKPSGWPVGHYTAAISIDGKPAATNEFEVK